MINEDYCSYEVAKLLKEKGFNWKCNSHYWSQDLDTLRYSDYPQNWNCASDDWYSCPTHQMAMKWLRKIYGIDIIIEITNPKNRKYYCMTWDGNNNSYILDLFNTYEEAVEAVLKCSLENLV